MPKRIREHCVGLKHVKQFTFECSFCHHDNTHSLPQPGFILFNDAFQCRNCRQWTRLKIFEPDHRKCDWCNLQRELDDRQFEDWCLRLCPECSGYFDTAMEAFNALRSFVIQEQLPKLIQKKKITGKQFDLKLLLPGGTDDNKQGNPDGTPVQPAIRPSDAGNTQAQSESPAHSPMETRGHQG